MPPSTQLPRKPEVKSPAGHWPQLHAAIEAGADAVYFGLKHFSARAKTGFALAELPDAMRTLHGRGVRGYVTFNTLVFEHELAGASRGIAAIAEAGADGIIVQDLSVVRLAREIAPGLELHGSTQMSITDARGVELARGLGVDRVTLARELSLDEIRAIATETGGALEIFVHGALCVAYSGQCFSSEAWGGRSANRGQCAQACRLPYELLVDGRVEPLGDARYLLSPGDLYALHQIPEIIAAGVTALKIEGRYKDADYVALTTRAYRKAVDEAWAGRPVSITTQEELQIQQVYSRGLGPYFLTGTNHQKVVEGRAPRHRGIHMGRVARIEGGTIVVETGVEPDAPQKIAPLKPGDGIVFDAADWRSPEEPEEGGRIYEVMRRPNGTIELRFGNGAIDFERVRIGDLVWRTHDPEVDRAAKPYTEAKTPLTRQKVNVAVRAQAGQPLHSTWTIAARPDIRVIAQSPEPQSAAHNRGLSLGSVREQFERLGNTPYELGEVTLENEEPVFVPSSVLNQIRREAIQQLQALETRPHAVTIHDPVAAVQHQQLPVAASGPTGAPELHVLVRTPEQLEAALAVNPASITLDYLDLYGLRPSIARVKASGIPARVASPRVLKPGEKRILDFLVSLDCPIVVRSAGLLHALRDRSHAALIGDFSLNAANSITASMCLELGVARLTPTHDLNAAQVADLAQRLGAERIEAIAYQHLPVFHTEHCVFCRFLSNGTSYLDCGRPCEKHRVELKDSKGRAHPVLADVGCRNTVFGAEAQEASAHLEDWRRAGICHFRLEFVHESGDELSRVYEAFDDALRERSPARELSRRLRAISPRGTTEGSLLVPSGYLQLPILQ